MRTLTWEPLVSSSLWVSLAVLLAILLAWYGYTLPRTIRLSRRALIVLLMSAGAAMVLAVLLNPTWIESIPRPDGKPLLDILVDASASMDVNDVEGAASRFDEAARIAREAVRRSSVEFDVQIKLFDQSVRRTDPDSILREDPTGERTDLAQALHDSLREDRPRGQATLLLSDGIQNVGSVRQVLDAARLAKSMSAPIFTATIGTEQNVKDVVVRVQAPQQLAFVHQQVPIDVRLRGHGLAGRRVTVSFERDGVSQNQEVELSDAGESEIVFDVEESKPGLFAYRVHVQPIEGEVTDANNSDICIVRVLDKPIRVLMLEGKPYWDSKFLVRTLASDPSIELDTVVRLAPDRFLRRRIARGESRSADEPTLSRSTSWEIVSDASKLFQNANALADYQVIVVGRDAEIFLNEGALDALRRWLSRDGGSLVCYRGSPTSRANEALGKLLPVEWTPARELRYHVELTPQGRETKWIGGIAGDEDALGRLPSLASSSRVDPAKPLAVTLAAATLDGGAVQPVVSYQPYGVGRSVVIEGAGMWRWAFLAPEHQALEEVYGSLWRNLLRWLVSNVGLFPGQDRNLRSDKVSFDPAEPVTGTVLLRDPEAEPPIVELTGGTLEEPIRVTPIPLEGEAGAYRVHFGSVPDGSYEMSIAGAEGDASSRAPIEVRARPYEKIDVAARPELMRRIAEASGGVALDPREAAERIGELFEAHLSSSQPERVRRYPAWDRWWVLVGILAVWTTAWTVRRLSGLT